MSKRTSICKIFRENGLKITIEANTTTVNFLDVTLDLRSGKHSPYNKPGNTPLYVHKKSNHPPSILENIPATINKRLSEISSDEDCFISAKPIYQDALNASGYHHNLAFNRNQQANKRKRQRQIIWFNPPYSKNVETNIGQCFLKLIDRHFPKSSHLHKIFNRITVKISYSCMKSVKAIISNHNRSVMQKPAQPKTPNCNCHVKANCPMAGNCLDESIVYQATVTTDSTTETYVGHCDTTFKARCSNHLSSFKHSKHRNSTELSKHVWNVKDQNTRYCITWRRIKQSTAYSNITKKCNLCLWEKFLLYANRTWPHSINATSSFLHVDTTESLYYARTLVLLDINSQPIY